MFGKKQHPSGPPPKLNKEHEELREEVIKSRKVLLKEIAKLNKKFDLNHTRRKP